MGGPVRANRNIIRPSDSEAAVQVTAGFGEGSGSKMDQKDESSNSENASSDQVVDGKSLAEDIRQAESEAPQRGQSGRRRARRSVRRKRHPSSHVRPVNGAAPDSAGRDGDK